ncbi:MAG: right-handed parallel beta-helix repeat-containing protein [Planctomycetota bacterium]
MRRARHGWHLPEVLLCTVPVVGLAAWLLIGSVADYTRVRRYDDWWTVQLSSAGFLRGRLGAAARLPRALALDDAFDVSTAGPGTLDLRVDPDAWDDLVRGPEPHFGQRLPATVVHDGQAHEVRLRLRGDSAIHWGTERRSLLLQAPKDALLLGRRRTVLSVKAPVATFLSHTLARDFGLLCPETHLVAVYLNGRAYSLMRATDTIDEEFLRRSKRMPGDIFRGDVWAAHERFDGLPRSLFRNAYAWDRTAVDARPRAPGIAPLATWIGDLNRGDVAAHRRLLDRIDQDELARLLAVMLVTGDPHHIDDLHNQFWYRDPTSGALHPVVWDLLLRDVRVPKPGGRINRMWRVLLRDPRLFAATLAELHHRLADETLLRDASRRVEAAWAAHRTVAELDLQRQWPAPRPARPKAVMGILRANAEWLRRRIRDDAKAAVAVQRVGPRRWLVDVQTRGWVGVRIQGLRATDGAAVAGALRPDLDRDGELDSDEPRWEPSRTTMPAGVRGRVTIDPEPLHYRWFVETNAAVDQLRIAFANAVTGEPVSVEPWAPGAAIPEAQCHHPWDLRDPPPPADVTLGGAVHLTEDLRIQTGQTLRIAAGTELRLDPDVSIVARGRILAEGTAAAPITVRPAIAGRPWGTVALQGEGASGSVLRHVTLRGGGGAIIDGVRYQGMVSVYHASRVQILDCELSRNRRCDDALNAVGADLEVARCWIHHANADAIDFDGSSGIIRDCRIEDAGNDAIDLMTCSPRIVGNRLRACGDKGISIGENAAPLVLYNDIRDCAIGIEVKDRSRPALVRNLLAGHDVGIAVSQKNWRYAGPGAPILAGNRVEGAIVPLQCDPAGRVTRVAAEGADLSWLLGPHGLVAGDGIGADATWATQPPSRRVAAARFDASLAHGPHPWRATGAVRRVAARDRHLVAQLRQGESAVCWNGPWNLPDGGWLVVEAAGDPDIQGTVRLIATGGTGVTTPLTVRTAPRFSTLRVPPGRYAGLEISTRCERDDLELRLHRWTLSGRL